MDSGPDSGALTDGAEDFDALSSDPNAGDGLNPGGLWRVESTGDRSPPNGVSVVVERGTSSSLVAKIYARGLTDVFGLAFRLRYDPARLEFIEAAEQDFLTNLLAQGRYVLTLREPGLVIYGGARFHPPANFQSETSGVDLEETLVASLVLQPLESGETQIVFDALGRDLRDADFDPIDTAWSSSRFVLQRITAGER